MREVGAAAGVGVGEGTDVAPVGDVEGGEQDVGGGAVFDGFMGEVRVGERNVLRITERN